jgi:S1-C subfamily serine protease
VQGADGATRSVSVTLGDNPNKPGTAYLGISYGFAHGAKRERGGLRGGRGVVSGTPVIAAVQQGSPAAQAGLQRGDAINEVNGKAIDSYDTLKSALAASKPGDKVTLKITRGSESQTVEVTLGENPNQQGAAYLGVTIGRGTFRRAPATPPSNTNTVTG